MRNENISNLDVYQMQNRSFDDKNDANRVVIVGQDFNLDQDKMAAALKEGIANIKLDISQNNKQNEPIIIKETQIERIEIPQIIEKEKIREIPVPIFHTKIERVEVPVIVPKVEIVQIEKPIFVKETVIHEIHSNDGIRKLQIALLTLNLLAMLIAIFKH